METSISKKYEQEISRIRAKITQLENGRIYENGGAFCDGYLSTNARQLRAMFDDLMTKLDNDLPSNEERMFSKIKGVADRF